ncbi:UNKNOWN [Stylonychia lemnae]|uniref:Uncharacterized protein n=1 Tax=Stylonychia lemnae TaxID=5949 RepID=A0A077ZPX8_STYLE|nr:UNKNOWN [Stylonychia lemnae]|eukprot:CDW71435.1 UNKNOWN [Stylonychia lemnae]
MLFQFGKLLRAVNKQPLNEKTLEELYQIANSHVHGSIIFQYLLAESELNTKTHWFMINKFTKESDIKSLFPYELISHQIKQYKTLEEDVIDKIIGVDQILGNFNMIKCIVKNNEKLYDVILKKVAEIDPKTLSSNQLQTILECKFQIFSPSVFIVFDLDDYLHSENVIIVLEWLLHDETSIIIKELLSSYLVSERLIRSIFSAKNEINVVIFHFIQLIYQLIMICTEYLIKSAQVTSRTIQNLRKIIHYQQRLGRYSTLKSIADWHETQSFDMEEIKLSKLLLRFIPLVHIMKNRKNEDALEASIKIFVLKSNMKPTDIFNLSTILDMFTCDPKAFFKILDQLLSNPSSQNLLAELQSQIVSCLNQSSHENLTKIVNLLILKGAQPSLKRNNKFIQFLILKLYNQPKDFNAIVQSLDIFSNLALQLLDNKYFDQLKDMIEYQLSINNSKPQIIQILGIIKKVTSSPKTEYGEKLLDLIEKILSKVNKPFNELDDESYQVATICLSCITDLIDNQILDHQLTYKIMNQKYSIFRSFDLSKMSSNSPLTREYARFLGCCVLELDDLELDQRSFNLLQFPRTEDVKDAIQTFNFINQVVFNQLLLPSHNKNLKIRAHQLKHFVTYIFEYGIQTLCLKEVGMELKDNNKDEFIEMHKQLVKSKSDEVRDQLYNIWKATQNKGLIIELIKHELSQKADSKQLRNVNFSKIQKEDISSISNIREKLISQAKDQINQKKGKAIDWKVIPQLILDTFENGSIRLEVLIEVLQSSQNLCDLTKLGSYLTNVLKYANFQQLDLQGLFDKFTVLDNNLLSFVLKEIEDATFRYESPELLGKIMFDLVKFYIKLGDTHNYLIIILKILASGNNDYISQLKIKFREIRCQLEKGKLDLDNFERLQNTINDFRLHQQILGNNKVSDKEFLIINGSEILSLLRIQIPKNQVTLLPSLVSLFQIIWNIKYENHQLNPNQFITDLIAIVKIDQVLKLRSLILVALAFAYLLKDRSESQYLHYVNQLMITNSLLEFKLIAINLKDHKINEAEFYDYAIQTIKSLDA